MLDLDGHIVGEAWELGMQRVYDPDRMSGAVEEVRISEGDVGRARLHLLPDIGQHDLALHNPKPPLIDGNNRAMTAEMLAAAAGLRISDQLLRAVVGELGVASQPGKARAPRNHECLTFER